MDDSGLGTTVIWLIRIGIKLMISIHTWGLKFSTVNTNHRTKWDAKNIWWDKRLQIDLIRESETLTRSWETMSDFVQPTFPIWAILRNLVVLVYCRGDGRRMTYERLYKTLSFCLSSLSVLNNEIQSMPALLDPLTDHRFRELHRGIGMFYSQERATP